MPDVTRGDAVALIGDVFDRQEALERTVDDQDAKIVQQTAAIAGRDVIIADQVAEIARLRALLDGEEPDPDPDPEPEPPKPTGKPLMGVPDNGNNSGFTQWDARRVYQFSKVAAAVTKGAKVIALTDSGTSINGGTAAAKGLRDFLTGFYGKTGAPSKNAGVQIHWANGNEVDRDTLSAKAFADTYEAMETVLKDFPQASLWIDGTANQLRQGNTAKFMAAKATSGRTVASMLDGYAGSYYPPGRNDYPNMATASYTGKSAPAAVIDPFIALAKQLGIKRMAIWEFGIPVLPSNPKTRPDYVKAFLAYWLKACKDAGLTAEVGLYWDQQKAGGPDNRLFNDNPATATVWRNAGAA